MTSILLLVRDNLMQTTHVRLSQKQTDFCQYICAFFKSALNFKDFEKKMTLISLCISAITDTKRSG